MKRQTYQFPGLSVIYEDNHLIAINKPPGALVHGDETGDETLSDIVKQYIKVRYEKPGDVFLGVIHRLDRPVSGVVIFARTSKALIRMNKMLQEKAIQKTYLAIVSKRPEELSGKLTHYIYKDESKNIVKAYSSRKSGTKEAVLDYNLIAELDGKVLLIVNPHTGRPHQIRAQLSTIECPIIGDLNYGAEYPLPDKSIALHCREMSFIHPVKNEPIAIKADPPRKFPWNIFSIE
ncbi:MAG: RluA family pseudouridine synthase [Saprospiraceae bacterium]|nr:RluA family pseudouridine synthase [Saprospiraceae bacterium]